MTHPGSGSDVNDVNEPAAILSSAIARDVLLTYATRRRYVQDSVLFRRNQPGHAMYLILVGEVELDFGDGRTPLRMSTDGFFGELALFVPELGRSATATALAGSELAELDAQGLLALNIAQPEIGMALVQAATRRLLASERRLVESLHARNRELEQTLDYLRRTREALSESEVRARTDALTGLYNRRCFDLQLPRSLGAAQAAGRAMALALIDLDRFKQVNDTHGHAVGDLVLQRVASALLESAGADDLPCRLGGDEFAVILDRLETPEAAVERCGRLFAALQGLSVSTTSAEVAIGSSLGAALARPGEAPEHLTERADRALYRAKIQRGQWQFDDGEVSGT
ncbi:MAG: hypothetical protein AMXMBFR25_01850 [Lysobacterales bacterium]